jgi:LL-diaminopimelate aminotransferase
VKFAERLEQLPPYVFSELRRKVAEKRASGADVIGLGAGDPDMATPQAVIEAGQLALADAANHHYPDNHGKTTFRNAAAAFMADRFDVALDPDCEIFPVLGGKEAIHHLSLLTLSPGDICLSPDPGYPIYRSGPVLAGATVHLMPLLEATGFLPDLEAIPSECLARARLMYLNYPNNPTGATASPDFFREVVNFARQNDLIVVHDNAYSEISFDGNRPGSFLAAPGAREVGVEVFSLSKGWNMTGWRLGWLAGNRDVIEQYANLKPNIDAGIFGALQSAAISAITDERDFPKKMSDIYGTRRNRMVEALNETGLRAGLQLATPFLWVRVPPGFSSAGFADFLLDEVNVIVSPGSAFGTQGEGFFRIALTASDDCLEEAARRIGSAMKQHQPECTHGGCCQSRLCKWRTNG